MTSRPTHCRAVQLARYPGATLRADDLALVTVALPPLDADSVLVRNRWSRVSISIRLMADPTAQAVEGTPFPVLRPGDLLAGGAVGEVIAAGPEAGIAPGRLVQHSLGWRDHAVVRAADCTPIEGAAIAPEAYLGHGWTA